MLDSDPSSQAGAEAVAVLEHDADLRATIPAEQVEAIKGRLLAASARHDPGPWDGSGLGEEGDLGLLVLEGLVTRDVRIGATCSRELLGVGDVIRPWDDEIALGPVGATTSWTILEPTHLALLDTRFAVAAGRWPGLGNEIVRRVLRRSRWLAVRLAIGNVRGVHERVMMLLWHLASHWGRVTPEGTLVPLDLTHQLIADLIGARRPSVTTAITELRESGSLQRAERGWVLPKPPPEGGSDPAEAQE